MTLAEVEMIDEFLFAFLIAVRPPDRSLDIAATCMRDLRVDWL